MKFRLLMAASLAAAALIGTGAHAASITVNNYSFELPNLASGTYQGDGIGTDGTFGPNFAVDWNSTGEDGAQNFGGSVTTSDGAQVLYVNGGAVYQDLGSLLAGTTYTLTVAAGNQSGFGVGSTGSIAFYNGADLSGVLLSSTGFSNQPVNSMTDYTTSFTTGNSVSGDLTVALARTSGDQMLFDNVRVTASAISAAPEPATWALMFAGVAMFGAALRLRPRKTATVAA